MVDYKHIWKVRMIQLIVITAICAVSGIGTAISEKDLLGGLAIWFLGTWIIGALVAAFSKSGSRVLSLGRNILSSLFTGTFAASSGGATLWVFFFMISMIKAMFGALALGALLAFEIAAYPFTTVYYFVKSR